MKIAYLELGGMELRMRVLRGINAFLLQSLQLLLSSFILPLTHSLSWHQITNEEHLKSNS